MLFDEDVAGGDLFFALAEAVGGDGLEGVDVVEVDAVHLGAGGVDVAGDGDVDHEEGQAAALAKCAGDVGGVDDGVGCAGGSDDDIDIANFLLPGFEIDGATADFFGEGGGFIEGAIGDDDAGGSAGFEGGGDAAGHVAGAEDHDAAFFEVAEDFAGELYGGGAYGGGSVGDVGGGADELTDAEDVLKEAIEERPGGSGGVGVLVGFFYLAEDFGLAEDHGVEPGGDAGEVTAGVLAVAVVEGVGGGGVVEGEAFVEEFARGFEGGCFRFSGGGTVDFDAVASGEDDGFGEPTFAEIKERFRKLGLTERDPFAEGDGGGLVIEAEADEGHGIGNVEGEKRLVLGDDPEGEYGEEEPKDGDPGDFFRGELVEKIGGDDRPIKCPDGVAEGELEAGGAVFHAVGGSNSDRKKDETDGHEANGGLREVVHGREAEEEFIQILALQQAVLDEIHDAGDAREGEGSVGHERDGGVDFEPEIRMSFDGLRSGESSREEKRNEMEGEDERCGKYA